MLGFPVFCAHTRSRCSDAERITSEPSLDEIEGAGSSEFSSVETTTLGGNTTSGHNPRPSYFSQ